MIQVCQQKVERKITHVTLRERVRCEDLRRSTGMRDSSNLAERLKWKDLRVTNDPEVRKTVCCGKKLKKKNFNSIGLAHL